MSVYGCPDQHINKWKHGYANITFSDPYFMTESTLGEISQEHDLLTLGPYDKFSYQLNFCTKVQSVKAHDHLEGMEWPRGRYAIYHTGNADHCPEGMYSLYPRNIAQ